MTKKYMSILLIVTLLFSLVTISSAESSTDKLATANAEIKELLKEEDYSEYEADYSEYEADIKDTENKIEVAL